MNKEKLKGYLEQVKTALGKVSKKIWILIAAVLVVLAVGVVIFLNTRPYDVLITGATAQEAGTVMSWLEEQGVTNYRMEGTGTILVPESQAANLKARLLMDRYSSTTSSFDAYFERVSALSTQSDREYAELVTLVERLESVIGSFENVVEANVDLALGEDQRYVLDDSNIVAATAAVKLTMREGILLTTEQANAIRNYVSHSVSGLDVENVSIVDTWGNVYDSFASSGSVDSSALKLQLEQEWSNKLRTQIMQLLTPAYGSSDDVKVAVNVVVELGDSTIEDHEVHLPDDATWTESGGAGIIGSRVYGYQVIANDDVTAGGLVGAESNAEIPTDVEQEPQSGDYNGRIEGNGSIEYNNSETWTYTIRTAGYISDCTVAVVLNSNVASVQSANIEDMRRLIAAAVGINPVVTEEMTAEEYLAWKVVVNTTEFPADDVVTEPEQPGGILGVPYWVIIALCAGILVFVLLLTIILLVRRRKRKKEEAEEQAVAELLAVAMPEDGEPVGADVMELHTEKSMELRQSIRDFVDENTEVAALLVRSWLKGDDDNG